MKRTGIRLNIENPCSQTWASMQSNEHGKYCLHCAKNVIDFTRLTDEEIVKVITQSNGSICGRLHKNQLNRVLVQEEERKIKEFKCNWLAGAMLMLGMGEPLVAGIVPDKQITVVSPKQLTSDQSIGKEEMPPDTLRNFFRGVLVDAKTREVLEGATIQLDSTQVGAITDPDGKFNIRIPADMLTDTLIFTINHATYEMKILHLGKDQLVNDMQEVFPVYEMQAEEHPFIDRDIILGGIEFHISTSIIQEENTQSPQQWWKFKAEDLNW
jgi:hypothetical protein